MIKVLVIEDDNFLVDAYSAKLQKSGFKVSLAANGEEGWTQARAQRPDVILLDLLLTKRNGFDLLADLKADPKLKKIPVIVLSNLGQERDMAQVRQLGADEYLIKANVSMKEVVAKIEKVMEKRHQSKTETLRPVDLNKKFKKHKKFKPVKLVKKIKHKKIIKAV